MTTKTVVKKNTYYDSVSLMSISTKANQIDGVDQAFVAMGTDMNKEVLRNVGLMTADLDAAGTGDLMMVIAAEEADEIERIYDEVEQLFIRSVATGSTAHEPVYRTLRSAAHHVPDANLAVISVNGAFAAREARIALDSGLHVMMFSDNMSIDDEVALKELAHSKGLLMMGADCGTAIINGVALCFGNAVREGSIGIVGASGTGSQEISVRIHGLGAGVSQLIGTGGRDLTDAVGGIMMIDAMRALDQDEATQVILLVSKPPAPAVEERVLAEIRNCRKPVVVCFIGGSEAAVVRAGGLFSKTTEEAARTAVQLVDPGRSGSDIGALDSSLIASVRGKLTSGQRFIRGLFCGGTLCDEAMYLAFERFPEVYSNIQKDPEYVLTAQSESIGHTFLDFGDDQFTNGKPHPMIDPSTRIDRFRREAEDPEVGVIVLDFILGFGAHEDPVGVLLPAIIDAKAKASAEGRHLEVLAYVLGTELDSQGLDVQIRRLEAAGATVARSSTATGLLAREFVSKEGSR